jgi:hypothetical protein
MEVNTVNTMEDGEINVVAGEEVVMKNMDYAKVKNKVIKPKKRIAGGTGLELSLSEELRAQFSTKIQKKPSNDGVKQNCNKNQNIYISQNLNQSTERIEQGLIQQVESEAQSLGNEFTNKSNYWYDQTSQNGREDLEESFKSNKKETITAYVLKFTKKGHSSFT